MNSLLLLLLRNSNPGSFKAFLLKSSQTKLPAKANDIIIISFNLNLILNYFFFTFLNSFIYS